MKTETESEVSSILSDSTPEPGFIARVLTSHATNAQHAELRRRKEERKARVKEKAVRKKQRAAKRAERAKRRAAGEIVPTETERSSSELSSDSLDQPPRGFFARLGEVQAHARKKAAARKEKTGED